LQQTLTVQLDDLDDVYRTFVLHTDITYLQKPGVPILSLISLNGASDYINIDVDEVYQPNTIFTLREKEVLNYVAKGFTSQMIADVLYISKQTVDKHRKNLLRKTGLAHATELVSEAIKNGWL
jgi:DNA-binding NarL/FixJ family response regulator